MYIGTKNKYKKSSLVESLFFGQLFRIFTEKIVFFGPFNLRIKALGNFGRNPKLIAKDKEI